MKVGVIGLGIVGSRVAANYQRAGHAVKVWNRTPQPEFPGWEPSLSSLGEWAEVLQIFVRDDEALANVLGGLGNNCSGGKVILNSSTVSKAATLAAAGHCASCGVEFLDAPFTGSREAAAAGQLVYYVGGNAATLERMTPLLEASGKEIIPTGAVGTATVLKIATNMVSAVSVQVLSEALALVRAQGLPLASFERAMASNASGSMLAKMKLPSMSAGDYQTHFSLKNMLKDSRYALNLAAEVGIEMPALAETSARMAEREAAGLGEADYSVLFSQFD